MKADLAAAAITAGLIASTPGALAQDGTDIHLAPLEILDGVVHIGNPVNVTDRPGYDNQPCFTPDGDSFYFTSLRDGQTDIFRYDIDRERVVRVTDTPESEYSPAPVPGSTGFSVVQVERDSTQRLWEFSADGEGSTLLFAAIQPVGYYAWGDPYKVALFVLGEPHVLQLADVRSGHGMHVAEDVGRCLAGIPGRSSVSFLHREDGTWWIKELSVASRRITPLVRAVPESQDYAWTPDRTILMASGSTVYHWDGRGYWQPAADLAAHGLRSISRLAVSPDGTRLALVADEALPEEAPSPGHDGDGDDRNGDGDRP